MDENLGLFGVCGIRMGTFDPEYVKVISGSFGALLAELGHNLKMVHRKVKWTTIGPQGRIGCE